MDFLVSLSDLLCEVQYFVAMALHLIVELLNRVFLYSARFLQTWLHTRHYLSKLLTVFEAGFGTVHSHLLLQLDLIRSLLQQVMYPIDRL